MPNIKKAFEVHKLEGKRVRTVYDYEETENKKGKKVRNRTETQIEEDNGWMVYFPNGSSIHVTSMAEMIRLGFADSLGVRDPELIDLDSGEVVGQAGSTSLRRKAERIEESSAERKKFRGAAATA